MNNVHLLELSQYEKPIVTEEKNRDWVGIGEENNYYQDLIDAYMNSTTNRSVITGIGQQIYGRGLDATDSNKKPEQFAQMKGLLKPDCLRKVCLDLKMLGEASLQVSYKGKKVASVSHFPRETLRAEKMNDKGQIDNYYYAPDWTKVTQATELTKMPVFGSKNSGNEIYVIKKYIPSYYYYSPADYSTSYPVLESEIADYLINETMSSFNSRTIVNFNSGVPSEEKMQEIKSQVLNRLTGANGEKVIVAFNHNAEQKTTIDSLPVQQAPELYEYLSEECKRMILLTHRVTSPLLIGLRDMGGSGLGSNEDEIKTAQRLFSNTTIKPYQDLICDALDKILEVNGISLNLYFKTSDPLEFIDVEVNNDEVQEEETGVKEELELEMLASKPHTPEITDEVLNSVADDLIDLGEKEEDLLKKYDVIDEMEVDYKQEERLDKMIGLASTGRAYPNAKSSQDGTSKQKSQEGVQFLVRYTYSPRKVSDNSREFCKKMYKANKVYRKEDILRMSDKVVNAGFGKGGSDTYSIWLYKGGARCSHKWFRKTYQIKDGKKTEITTGQARSKGFKPQVNEQKVSVAPKDMPNEGFVNKPKKKK
jgi:hypothetical protein